MFPLLPILIVRTQSNRGSRREEARRDLGLDLHADRAGSGQRAGPRWGGHSGSKSPCQRLVDSWRVSRHAHGGAEAPREREGVLRCLPGS